MKVFRILSLLILLGWVHGCRADVTNVDECKSLYKAAVNHVEDVFYPYIDAVGMNIELQKLIVRESEKLNKMYLELSSCYTNYIRLSRESSDFGKALLERRSWVDNFGKFSGYISALSGYLRDEGFKEVDELYVEHMFFLDYLKSISP